jgi:hypothetical protein
LFDAAKERGVNKILVNCLAMDGQLLIFDRFGLVEEVVAYLKPQGQTNVRLAFVGQPPTIDGCGVLVVQNRGLTTALFASQEEALIWLNKWPS